MIKLIVKIGKHELKVKEQPDLIIDGEKGIASIILVVEDKDGKTYELHYMSTLDDPDLIVKDNSFLDL